MPQRPLKLIEFESPWPFEPGVVRTFAPAENFSPAHWQRFRTGDPGRPFIVENGLTRNLYFTLESVQSAMQLDAPDALLAPYTRKMMAFLLFNSDPRHIVMIGLGGGSLAKFCYRHLPQTHITVVEVDADVIALRNEFCIPGDDERFRVVHDDGARFMGRMTEDVDIILVDAFDAVGIAPSLPVSDFYAKAQQRLRCNGLLVMNLSGERTRYVSNINSIRAAFNERILLIPVKADGNVLLFAFKMETMPALQDEIDTLAEQLQQHLALEFPRFLERLRHGHVLRDAPEY